MFRVMRWRKPKKLSQDGFSIVEVILTIIILPLVVVGIAQSLNAVRHAYKVSRQLNEMYTVLSACPELDRALEYNSVSSTNNCYPNNSFAAENGGTATISYAPTLTVTDTTSLSASDPLKVIPDSKVINISVPYPGENKPAVQLRMLITRNGIGQQ